MTSMQAVARLPVRRVFCCRKDSLCDKQKSNIVYDVNKEGSVTQHIATGKDPLSKLEGLDYGLLHGLLGHLLRHAFNHGQAVFAEVFEDDAITPLQFMIIELVSHNPHISHSQICTAMGAAASVVTTTLKPLIAKGYIVSEALHRDRRVSCYQLSDEGADWFAGIRPKIDTCEDRFARSLSAQQRRNLLHSLRLIAGLDA
ncbi:MarR family winged helix-turn-helix transcriptional regulator [Hoeflea sp. TYP-13]|uniref:MarR family winged helix-turn-helix transcriptional regulator n=1 Tax=Hoeflea sp. TYP-13 TaxID=3230023 RepID=UPI0034C5D09C